ncbi:RNA polymerase sigma-70 factor, ECF subfamily [Sporobacter termitidis DSM 10068]|uniref:RNA polymerase sigma-70 factor, ECF subfamily n=1 Tax=Sporobacter termitidis DSM 10068 TaxID=1123282 RepID=A0A1M5ZFU2_9FIRM|nr:RNA polymerase sigma factor [Sporobacter termitidis]SHI23059.1 RNA polymerase sigma-70 factor, ECF subfamily [Sporobacter termitidis DSM 10068]
MDEEHRLIRRIQKTGSAADADTLIRKYYDEIYVYAYRQTSDKETAMDLTQDIFVSVLKSIGRYDGSLSSFRTWLYRVATNKAIDRLRSRQIKNVPLDVDALDAPDESAFARQMEIRDMTRRLQSYVGTMDTDTQQIFRLKFFGEYTFSQIAEVLSIPESTVKTKYYRMLKSIKKEFDDEYTDAR